MRKSVAKDLRTLPNKDVEWILRRIKGLIDDPRPAGCEKLSAQERYRVWQGAYRIVYEVKDNELIVTVVSMSSACLQKQLTTPAGRHSIPYAVDGLPSSGIPHLIKRTPGD